jgi:serine/threonine protein phosphatase 1
MPRTIAIGDVHGCSETLKKLLLETIDLQDDDTLVFLGDYIDRGPDSRGVVNLILAMQQSDYNIITLRGNHEQMLLDSEMGFTPFSGFVNNGGDATLTNYDVDFLHEMPQAHQDFFKNTQLYYETEHCIFVHAGLNFANSNLFADIDAMLWIRDVEPYQPRLQNKILVHGHTPIPLSEMLQQKGNCYNIDAGCVFYNIADKGYLVALHVEEMKYYYVQHCEPLKNNTPNENEY